MIYLGALLAGMVGAVVGWFVTGVVALWIAGLCGMSDFEGGRGMFAFLAVGPIGGLLGMIGAAWAVLRQRFGPLPGGGLLMRLVAVLAGIAALVAGGIWLRLATLDTYTDTLPPQLEFELRVPAALAGARKDVAVELDTDKNVADATLADDWRDDGATRVLSGSVSLDFKTTSRLLVVSLPEQPKRLFRLRLGRDPDASPALGDWQPPDFTHAPGEGKARRAADDDPFALRYRVSVAE
ncbi:MAG TPA: hypothetical protein VL049_14010 [Candidatus Dormibacteraeota bacterium]|nr:hypothetical protein [Candidatus Dormibacteraeota bacterium]